MESSDATELCVKDESASGFSILTLPHQHLFIIHTKNVCLGVRPCLTHHTSGNFPHFHSTCLRHGETELYRRVRGCVYFCTLMVDQFISPWPRDSLQDGDRQNWLRGRFWDRTGIRPHLNIWLMWLCRGNVMFLEPLLRVSWGSSELRIITGSLFWVLAVSACWREAGVMGTQETFTCIHY